MGTGKIQNLKTVNFFSHAKQNQTNRLNLIQWHSAGL